MGIRGPGKREADGLTRRERQFVNCYLESSLNKEAACEKMGFEGDTATIQRYANRYMKSKSVQTAIAAATANLARVEGLRETSAVMREIETLGFANMQDFVDDTGMLRPLKDLPRETAAAITDYEFHPERGFKIKLASKLAALQTLAKIYGHIAPNGNGPGVNGPTVAVQVNLVSSPWKETDTGAAIEASYSSQ